MSAARYRAVLTGATGGIGRAMALRLAPLCESLILVGRDAATLVALARDVATAVNQILPGLVDFALRRQLPVMRRHARESDSQITSQGAHP